ncbi:23S rRNA (uracil(1939)-C(5))-methyltransferase RlmD [Methylophilus methylotrophus]|uniref:23S rRNA (uracil(1939)-C(5))-methyltransferase RlmD n=1 Tax=Methylophilus methylotrophus TaxID=17 RepID=UPI000F591364|nr:23S rRNA (uracil(1939)-C(5))-methyltransferase RlmD [Methylophilus methylotrophus]
MRNNRQRSSNLSPAAKAAQIPRTATIESLDQEGRGVTHVDGKVIFIEGALPFEEVRFVSHHVKSTYELATTVEVIKASSQRVTPGCTYFGTCGGCAMQHLEFSAQVAAKQRMLEDDLWHIGRVRPEKILPPIQGTPWHYRHKARLRVRYVEKKGGVLVGFNEKGSSFVTFMDSCEVLTQPVSDLIVPLKQLIGQLSIKQSLPQIELAVGEDATVLVFRILEALSEADVALMKMFEDTYGAQVWTQTKGPDTVKPLFEHGDKLHYSLPEYDLEYPFSPTEFTQVNPAINRVMIRRAMQLLQPQTGERIADFFCGLGNFTLPIARSGASVYGVEGSQALVKRAIENAGLNGIENVEFAESDLFDMTAESLQSLGAFDKWLVDPPRDGAIELIKALPDAGDTVASHAPWRIVYVSCNPSTLSRDAAILTQVKGYRLLAAGVMNMFPHTAHVESIAIFEKA